MDLLVRGPANDERVVHALIDTGFTGSLALPTTVVNELGLVHRTRERAMLADGREILLGVHEATVSWDGRPRHVPVLAAGSIPLVGMALLSGCELTIQVAAGGTVRIDNL